MCKIVGLSKAGIIQILILHDISAKKSAKLEPSELKRKCDKGRKSGCVEDIKRGALKADVYCRPIIQQRA